VCSLSGERVNVLVEQESTVLAVKQQLFRETGVPVQEMQLVAAHEILRDDQMLPSSVLGPSSNGVTLVKQQASLWREDLMEAPSSVKSNRTAVLKAVKHSGMSLRHAAPQLRADREIVLAAVEQQGTAVQFASDELRDDREIALAAVQQAGWALRHLSKELRGDRQVVLSAVSHSGWALADASADLRRDKTVVAAAIHQSSLAEEFALPTQSSCSDAEASMAVDSHVHVAVRRRTSNMAPAVDAEGSGGFISSRFSNCSRRELVELVRACPMSLRSVPPEYRRDREIVLAAVQEEGAALQFADSTLRIDRGVVLSAVRQAGWALQFAAISLQADREIVMAAVKQSGWALYWAAPILRADKEVVMTAVGRDPLALRFAVCEIQSDPDLVAAASWQRRRDPAMPNCIRSCNERGT